VGEPAPAGLGRVVVVWTGPVGRCDENGRDVIEVPPEVTDEDLEWLNAHSLGVRVEREAPKADLRPDPRLSVTVWR
jgi:hypothetical protein